MFLCEIICGVNGSRGVEVGTRGHFLCPRIIIFESLKKKISTIQVDKVQLTTFVIFSKIGKFEIGQNSY